MSDSWAQPGYWRMPTRIEHCGCTECPVDQPLGCSSTQTLWDAWPWWFIFHWVPRRALCAVIGHRISIKWRGPNQCDRCLSKRVVTAKFTGPDPHEDFDGPHPVETCICTRCEARRLELYGNGRRWTWGEVMAFDPRTGRFR